MTKLLIAVVFSVLLLVPVGAQNVFGGAGGTTTSTLTIEVQDDGPVLASDVPCSVFDVFGNILGTGVTDGNGQVVITILIVFGDEIEIICTTDTSFAKKSIIVLGNQVTISLTLQSLVGGKSLTIDTTSLLLAGAQMTASWLIPVIVVGAGIVLVLVRRKF